MPTQPHLYADSPNAKRILIICDEGVNRSHTIKGQLQYWGHDILTVGLNRNSPHTIALLAKWANIVIITAEDQIHKLNHIMDMRLDARHADEVMEKKLQFWDIGPDKFPRPYNTELLKIVRALIDEHREELAPPKKEK